MACFSQGQQHPADIFALTQQGGDSATIETPIPAEMPFFTVMRRQAQPLFSLSGAHTFNN